MQTQGNDDANSGQRNQGSEDTRENVAHVQEAAENRDALAAQARRVEATTPAEVDSPIEGTRQSASGSSESTRENQENLRRVEENTRAQAEQARRVEASTPPDLRREGDQI